MSWIKRISIVALLLLTPALAGAGETDVELAKKYYKLGAELYKRGDYQRALSQFEESYRLSKRPELLYNMGRCREGMNQPRLAMAHYNEYLKSNPRNAKEVRTQVTRLDQKIKKKQAAAKAKNQPAPQEPGSAKRTAGWVLVGVGAAGLVAGGVLGGLAMSKQGTVEDAYNNMEMTYPELQAEMDAGEGLELGAIISLAVGGAAAAAGAVLLILDYMGDGEQQTAWIAPGFSSDGALVNAGLRF